MPYAASSRTDTEYISLGADNQPVLKGRTPIEAYRDFMAAFKNAMGTRLGSTINEVQVGLGPCGELRYPAYQLDRWAFPGIGEFQVEPFPPTSWFPAPLHSPYFLTTRTTFRQLRSLLLLQSPFQSPRPLRFCVL